MLYKRELINSSETIGYSRCIMMGIVMGPSGCFTHVVIILDCLGQVHTGVVHQRRLCSIFWSGVG